MASTTSESARPSEAWFLTTHWSVVLSARAQPSSQSAAALEVLCRTYWHPLYAYVRRQGHSPADAQDLTQEFFARLLQKDYLHSVARTKGKFRTFLLVMLKRFLADEWDKARAQKRGGGQVFCVDWSSAETRVDQAAESWASRSLAVSQAVAYGRRVSVLKEFRTTSRP